MSHLNHPKVKKFQSKPFPLFNQLTALYEGSFATGDLNFTSIQQQVPSIQQQVQHQDEAVSSFRSDELELDAGLNPFSSNLEGQAFSSSHANIGGNESTPTSSLEHREESHGRKRKQSQLAGVLEDYLEFKKDQSNKFLNELNQPTKESNKDEYSIAKCVAALESMEDLTDEEMAKALGVFKCEKNREIFMNTKKPRVRLLWLRGEIDKKTLSP